jgi:hypothetical protein
MALLHHHKAGWMCHALKYKTSQKHDLKPQLHDWTSNVTRLKNEQARAEIAILKPSDFYIYLMQIKLYCKMGNNT